MNGPTLLPKILTSEEKATTSSVHIPVAKLLRMYSVVMLIIIMMIVDLPGAPS